MIKNKEPYFKHDYNPTNDPKIICLLGNYGGLGYGVYWRTVELLHQETNHKLSKKLFIYEAIAKQMQTNAKQIEAIINDCINKFELLVSDDYFFWSNRVLKNLEDQQKISNIRSLAGRAGAIAKQNLAKPAKEKKIKEKKNISLQTVVCEDFDQNKYITEMIKSDKKHISLIGKYFLTTKKSFPTLKAIQAEIKRWVKDASIIAEYPEENIDKTYVYVSEKFPNEWNLSTIKKYIAQN